MHASTHTHTHSQSSIRLKYILYILQLCWSPNQPNQPTLSAHTSKIQSTHHAHSTWPSNTANVIYTRKEIAQGGGGGGGEQYLGLFTANSTFSLNPPPPRKRSEKLILVKSIPSLPWRATCNWAPQMTFKYSKHAIYRQGNCSGGRGQSPGFVYNQLSFPPFPLEKDVKSLSWLNLSPHFLEKRPATGLHKVVIQAIWSLKCLQKPKQTNKQKTNLFQWLQFVVAVCFLFFVTKRFSVASPFLSFGQKTDGEKSEVNPKWTFPLVKKNPLS